MKQIILMIVAYALMVYVNMLATFGTINGQTTAEVSNKLDVLVRPAGYVVSIWGLIYFLLALWLFLQFKRRDSIEPTSQSIAYLFVASCIFNILWLICWHYELFGLAQLFMFGLLFTLIALYKQYPIRNNSFAGRLPFSIYLGWISVATIVNMAYTLKYFDVSLGIDEVPGTIVLIIIAGLLALIGRKVSDDPYFALVFVWAIIGIAVGNENQSIVTTAYIVAVIVFVGTIVFSFMGNKDSSKNALS